LNPYAPTTSAEEFRIVDPSGSREGSDDAAASGTKPIWRTSAKWLLVCGLSAIPSFMFGAAATRGQYGGMLLGILAFVAGYTWLDRYTATRHWRRDSKTQRTLRVAYGTRIALSVLFPIGAWMDVILGATSVHLYYLASGEHIDNESFGVVDTFLTTLIQGCLLNIVLVIYMGIVHSVQSMFAWMRDPRSV
jgi:hypothetical protein